MKLFMLLLISMISFGQSNQNVVENQIIVKFKTISLKSKTTINNFLNNSELSKLHSKINVLKYQTINTKQSNKIIIIKYDSDIGLEEIISFYENTGLFEYVEPNYTGKGSGVLNTIPNDSEYSNQWGLKNDGTFSNAPSVSGADIEMELAWDIETGDPNMIVAIIDTGLRLAHPEFSGRLWNNVNEVADGTDTDNNGFIDDLVAGWDFINSDNDPTDDHGHGTNVAGIALASGNNTIGYAGVNWNAKVMICKALNENNSGSYAAMAGAIYYAVDNGAKVINMSIGGSGNSITLSDAIDYCYDNGVVLVACMMNFNNSVTYYPAGYNKTIAVGATNPDDTRSNPFFWSTTSGSNFGSHIDLVAPGNYMYGLSDTSDTYYGSYWGGTSQASPLVAGVVSLLLSQNPALTFEEIRTILRESSEDQVGDPSEDINGFDTYYGYGRLNAKNALSHQALSINNFENANKNIVIYPNPINRNSQLEISNLIDGDYTINIYNAFGQNLQSKNTSTYNSKITFSISNLNAGIYFLRVKNESKNSSVVKKLIIN
jgi:thermitase